MGGLKAIVVCADDYGIAPGVGIAIRDLIAGRRISATSCMTVSPSWAMEAAKLRDLNGQAEIGLHLTLTDVAPAGPMPGLAPEGRLPPLPKLIVQALSGGIAADEVAGEVDRQIDRFIEGIGRLPDFLDGHQHVHQLPGVRAAVFAVFLKRLKPAGAWIRYATVPLPEIVRHRLPVGAKTAVITLLGAGFRAEGERLGIAGNASFRGVRTFSGEPPYAVLLPRLLAGLGEGGLLMCHPGLVDAELAARDPVTAARVDEYETLKSDAFPALLAERGLRIGTFRNP
jgi:hypothetical protein